MSKFDGGQVHPTVEDFAAHIRAFHAELPAEEQVLLERVFALAEAAIAAEGEVSGHTMKYPDISLNRGLGASQQIYQWLSQSLTQTASTSVVPTLPLSTVAGSGLKK